MFVGVNDAKATRKSVGSAYKGHWTGFGFSTQAGAEFLAGSETIKAGPFALVDYSWLRTPSFSQRKARAFRNPLHHTIEETFQA